MAYQPVTRTGSPGVSADASAGFAPGASWTDSATGVTWICISNTAGAAVWSANPRNVQTTSAPTTSNDSSQGYAPGSIWTDTVAQQVYACVSAAVGAAVWVTLSALAMMNGGVLEFYGDSLAFTQVQSGGGTVS